MVSRGRGLRRKGRRAATRGWNERRGARRRAGLELELRIKILGKERREGEACPAARSR